MGKMTLWSMLPFRILRRISSGSPTVFHGTIIWSAVPRCTWQSITGTGESSNVAAALHGHRERRGSGRGEAGNLPQKLSPRGRSKRIRHNYFLNFC